MAKVRHKFFSSPLTPKSCSRCGMPKGHDNHLGSQKARIRWTRIFKPNWQKW